MPNTLREQVGERITVLREARGLSQRDLSDELAKLGLVVAGRPSHNGKMVHAI